MQLQSILLPTENVCNIPELYYHKSGNRIDFDGYFNLFYIEKRKKYTSIDNVWLSLKLIGYKSLIIVHDRVDIHTEILLPEEEKEYQFEFPYSLCDKGVFYFSLIEDELVPEKKIEGFFTTNIEIGASRNVNIGIDICTFKREAYVLRNLKQLSLQILENTRLDLYSHVKIYVIDNGQTLQDDLDIQKIVEKSDGNIKVYRNKNAGGAGGFTRGMLEILNDKQQLELTHVLIMDDDAVVEPDAVVRMYGILCTLKEEWKDMTIGGAMLREDYPYMLFCAGEWWEKGEIHTPGMHRDLREYACAASENLTEASHEHDRYSGWWCCCFSLNTVRDDNLPLPIFIHYDDIEFGWRNRNKGILFLNGVGVWHKGAELVFPGANLYYDIRNDLIQIVLDRSVGYKYVALKFVLKAMTVAAIKMKYKDIDLIYRGFLDFLKGPGWLHKQDPVKLNSDIRALSYVAKPLESLKTILSEKEYASVQHQIRDFHSEFGIDKIIEMRKKKIRVTLLHYLSYNGWFLPPDRKGIRVISSTESLFNAFRKKGVVWYEPGSRKAIFVKRDYRELKNIIKTHIKVFIAFWKYFDHAAQDYQKHIGTITNRKAWEEYLK